MNLVLPLLTSGLSLAFAVVLGLRFARRHAGYYAVWALGLVWYALSAATEVIGQLGGWNAPTYRMWYATGAIGVAAYLGAGTLYLHRDRAFGALALLCIALGAVPALAAGYAPPGLIALLCTAAALVVLLRQPSWFPNTVLAILVVTSVAAAFVIFSTPVDFAALPRAGDETVTGQAEPESVRVLTPAFNIGGASILLLGAVASGITFAKHRGQPRRVVSNALIALGAFVPSLTSGLTRFGFTSTFFLGQLIGVLCLLVGFMLTRPYSHKP